MARWQPDAQGRLEQAALSLYAERGYEGTTVTEIAAEAGLTERTFFRHFADKREVLFARSSELAERMVAAVDAAPAEAPAMAAVGAGLDAIGEAFVDRREHAVRRQAVIMSSPELRERELSKLASMSAALGEALRRRGVGEPGASLAAEAGIAVFRVGFERWVEAGEPADLGLLMRDGLAELRQVTADG
jgi:AcrR family transcriptional regulator